MSATWSGHDGARASVVAFGEVLFDQFRDREVMGGAPFNVACHLHAFGACPLLLSRVGSDTAGDDLRRALVARGMRTEGLQRDRRYRTGCVRVVETPAGHRFDVLDDQAYDHIDADAAAAVTVAAAPRLVYFGTLAQRGDSRNALQRVLDATEETAFLDLNLRDPWVDGDVIRQSLQRARIVKLNEIELARLAPMVPLPGQAPRDQLRSLVTAFDLECAVLTCGADGAVVFDPHEGAASVEGSPLPAVVDTVGAGDAFAAVYALGWLRRWPQALRLLRADAFARAICGIRGAIPDSPDLYRPFIETWRPETAGDVDA